LSIESSFFFKLKYTNIIDERDHPILPRSGAYLKSTLELAGLGGDVKFVKANADYQVSKTFFEHFVRFCFYLFGSI